MTDHTPNLEQIIADHRLSMIESFGGPEHTYGSCSCGRWRLDIPCGKGKAAPMHEREHAAHVVAVIRDSGYTVIALPEPSKYTPSGQPSWSRAISVAVDRFNEIVVGRTWWINRHEAADLGAALIAAAQLAKGDTQ